MDNPSEETSLEKALRNPMILRQIFQNDAVNGKTVRLVCKLWNEILISLHKTKLCLDLNANTASSRPLRQPMPFQHFCLSMEPKLARSIQLQEKCKDDVHRAESTNLVATAAMLLHTCDKFSDQLRYMNLTLFGGNQMLTLYKILYNNRCPNLKGISIQDDKLAVNQGGGVAVQSGVRSLPPRKQLTSIYLKAHYKEPKTTSLCTLGQLLINSAPNLERLELSTHHYFPDLSGCPNLRALIIPRGPKLRRVKFEEFARMLQQVADHIEILKIGCEGSKKITPYDHSRKEIGNPEDFKIPPMPRLKIFRNDYTKVFKSVDSDALEDISGVNCPNLRFLFIGKNQSSEYIVDDLLRRVVKNKTKFSVGMTRLTLEGITDPTLLVHLKTSFPHLESLNITLLRVNQPDLGSTMESCGSLGLSHLTLHIPQYPEKLSQFVDCFLDNWKMFKALKTFWIRPAASCLFSDDLKSNPDGLNILKQFVLTMAGMQRAVIWHPPFEKVIWWDRIYPFIRENNIPVEFKGASFTG